MNKQFYERQLADLKKANKERKLKLAQRAGYYTVEEYRSSLEKTINNSENVIIESVEIKPKIHNVIILDNSSSMRGSKFNNAYRGVKDEIEKLTKDSSVKYTQTFCYFGHLNFRTVPKISSFDVSIQEFKVPKIAADTGTPLYDSIVEVANRLQDIVNKDTKILVKIFTDGRDMHSRRRYQDAASAIKNLKKLGITVTFVGTKDDVDFITRKLNVDISNTLVHDNTGEGVKRAFSKTLDATMDYSSKVKRGEDVSKGFYKSL